MNAWYEQKDAVAQALGPVLAPMVLQAVTAGPSQWTTDGVIDALMRELEFELRRALGVL